MSTNRDTIGLLHGRAKISGGLFETADRNFCEIVGRDLSEILGMTVDTLYRTKEGASDFLFQLTQLDSEGRYSFVSTTWCLADGSVADIVVRAEVFSEDTDDSFELEVCDTSAAHRSSRLAKLDEHTLRAILEHSPMGFGLLILDPSGNRVMGWHNPAMKKIFGYEDGFLWGKSSRLLYENDEQFENAGMLINSQIKEHGASDFFHQMKHRNGSVIDVRVQIIPINLGNEIPMLTMVEDRTQQVEAEKKYRYLFESSLDSLLLLDPDARVIDCNPAALKMFDIRTTDGFIGLTPVDVSPEFQPDGTASQEKVAKVLSAIDERESILFEWRFKSFDGREFDGNVLLSKLEIDGRPIFQTTVRDISEQKRTQDLLVQSEKMVSVGGLAAGMAHEINNPLAGMLQGTSLLKNRLVDPNVPANQAAAGSAGLEMGQISKYVEERKINTIIDSILNAGDRMSAIIGDMLSFARKSNSSFTQVDPRLLVDRALSLASSDYDLKKNYDFRSIEISKKYACELPQIQCIESEIQQVLLNILSNGAHAMFSKKASREVYRPRFNMELFTEDRGRKICMVIEDNGPGIDKEHIKRVLEPFFTTKPVGEGTGLGLSIAYFIVAEKHGGTIDVESKLGEGTRFLIRLPAKPLIPGERP